MISELLARKNCKQCQLPERILTWDMKSTHELFQMYQEAVKCSCDISDEWADVQCSDKYRKYFMVECYDSNHTEWVVFTVDKSGNAFLYNQCSVAVKPLSELTGFNFREGNR